MKLLQLTKKFPYPIMDGESIAIHNLSRGLVRAGVEVHLLALNTLKHHASYDRLPDSLSHYDSIESVDIDTQVRLIPLLRHLIKGTSYNVARFKSREFDGTLVHTLKRQQFDVIQLETLYLVPYIPTIRKHSSALIALRSHNVESEIWHGLSRGSRGWRRWYYGVCAERLAEMEDDMREMYDVHIPISAVDHALYTQNGHQRPSLVLPIGMDLPSPSRPDDDHDKLTKLGFIGTMDWRPNVEGIRWFLDNAWPLVREEFPEIEFHLAGRNMPQELKEYVSSGVTIHGEVADAGAFVQGLDVVVAPVFSGSGIKVKILEAMAYGRVVMSTKMGFEGIPVVGRSSALVFENAQELIAELSWILAHKDRLGDIKINARQLIKSNFDLDKLALDLKVFYEQNALIKKEL